MNFLQRLRTYFCKPIDPSQVHWVVNDNGELGVRVADTAYFPTSSGSYVYRQPHPDGVQMMQRLVTPRELDRVFQTLQAAAPVDAQWFPLTDGTPSTVTKPFDEVATFLDSYTTLCPHGCNQDIRPMDVCAHEQYGCATAVIMLGRGSVDA